MALDLMTLKQQVHQNLSEQIEQRITNAKKAMEAAANARNKETKSSSGDKFETNRAMMHAQEERNKVQLIKAISLKNNLLQIKQFSVLDKIGLGCLVFTSEGKFYLSVGFGKLKVNGITIYAISRAAPIGKLLWNKCIGEKIIYNGKTLIIQDLI